MTSGLVEDGTEVCLAPAESRWARLRSVTSTSVLRLYGSPPMVMVLLLISTQNGWPSFRRISASIPETVPRAINASNVR